MNMSSVAFDTHGYYKNLIDAGMDERHAEAIAVGILRAHEVANLATKTDVQTAVDMAQAKTDAKIDRIASELDAKIDRVAAELNAKIDKEISEVKQEIMEVKGELKLLKWMMGATFASVLAILLKTFFGA